MTATAKYCHTQHTIWQEQALSGTARISANNTNTRRINHSKPSCITWLTGAQVAMPKTDIKD
ncbi:hypothetical protein KZZ04_09560 [Pseudoalteromonas sp. CR1]|uniref:hypothetical protein n=1 Tax=Pseudoalteromonas sp. CR1 TaxID=2861964 RepID=UPI001C5DD972|nr:hypothetical protein [Pseudoalteromonas sp. CR1]MBW4966611.1 hypothetical protein [Pseudoalteromonas sp. CR1]